MCNAINYNVIFLDKIQFNVMTIVLIYFWMTKKHLLYYCYVNWCYCAVCEVVNLSICRMDIGNTYKIWHQTLFTPMEILTDYTLHTGIPIKYIRQYILETIRTIPFHHSTVHGVYYIRVYRSIVLNDIFQRPWKLFNFTLILFIMCIIYGYTDGMCLSMYSRDYRNCSLLNGTVHNVH